MIQPRGHKINYEKKSQQFLFSKSKIFALFARSQLSLSAASIPISAQSY
jgi:hypothetical protein